MGIYVKNIEIPTKIDPDNYIELACEIDGKQYARLYNIYYGGLAGWCEVIPVSESHGRLIESAELYDKMENIKTKALSMCDKSQSWQFGVFWAIRQIEEALTNTPTIIPADESDMDSFIHIFEEDNEEDGMDSFIRIFKD